FRKKTLKLTHLTARSHQSTKTDPVPVTVWLAGRVLSRTFASSRLNALHRPRRRAQQATTNPATAVLYSLLTVVYIIVGTASCGTDFRHALVHLKGKQFEETNNKFKPFLCELWKYARGYGKHVKECVLKC
ncbi:AGAP011543-PB, partial [Anopheles gambiae str. PEST]